MNIENASDSVVKLDRMRYTKDTLSANLIIVAIVLDALYFVKLYQQDVSDFYYKWWIGASVIYNLVFMLSAFLCSESVKNRKTNMTALLVILSVMQFVRIGQIPAMARAGIITIGETVYEAMSAETHTYLIVLLVASGVCLAVATVTSLLNARKLGNYMKTIETKSA